MDNLLNKDSVKRVKASLDEFDKSIKILVLDQTARTANDAAKALSCEVGAIVKSLLIKTDNTFILCLVSGDKRCSLNKLKKLTGKKDVCMANAESVKKHTGFTIGSVSPVGLINSIEIMIDKLIESAPGNEVPKLLEEADLLFKDQKFEEAQKIYESLVGIDPGNPKIISGLLRCLVQLKKYDDANEIIESLDEETIKSEEIIKIKKLIDNIGNESFENFEDLKSKLDADPDNKEIRFNLANSYLAANETKLGFDELLSLFDKDPKWNDEAAKKKILEYFDILGLNDPNVIDARKKLSSMMFK